MIFRARPYPHNPGLIYLIPIIGGLVIGLIVGRWWALAAPIALGVWIGVESNVDEVPPWFLGSAYALISGIGVGSGVLLRRRFANPSPPRGS